MSTPPVSARTLSPLARSERHQTWLLWATVVGTLASLAGVVLLAVTPDPLAFDYVQQAGLAVVYGSCAAWLLFFANADPNRIAVAISLFTTLAFGARFASAVLVATDTAELETMLLPYSGWWALVILVNFVLLPLRSAIRLNLAYWLALVGGTIAAALLHPLEFASSFQLICMTAMLLTGMPLFALLVYGLATTLDAGWANTDRLVRQHDATLAQCAPQVTEARLLDVAAPDDPSRTPRWLAVAALQDEPDADGLELLRACLVASGETWALLPDNQLAWLSSRAEAELRTRLERFESRLRALDLDLSVGLAAHHAGETPRTWLDRARFAAFAARDAADHRILFES